MRTTTRRRGSGLLALLVVLALLGCEPGDEADDAAEPAQGTAGFSPSFVADEGCFGFGAQDIDTDVECGMVEVPLHHDDPDGPTIELATAVLAGSESDEHERPLLLLGGGPGEALVESALTLPGFHMAFDVGPDLIVVDQRGAGSSRPALECPEVPELEAQDTVAEDVDAALDAMAACHQRLTDEGVPLDAFDHLENARDVDMIRRALGHEQLDVRGASYGTQVALLAAEANPEGIRSLVLSSPLDPTENWVEGAAAGLAQALAAIADACEADEGCSAAFGDLDAALTEVTERLAEQPEEVTVTTPDGEEVSRTYTPSVFLDSVTTVFYLGDAVALLPALIGAASDGELEPLARIAALIEQQVEATISTGMQLSMLCSGEAGLFDPEASRDRLDGGLIEQHWFPAAPIGGAPTSEACEIWEVEQDYDPGAITLDAGVPALIVTGAFDHVTPPELGEQLDAALATSHLVEVPVAGHGPLEALGPCGRQLVGDFLADPETAPDAGCATQIPLQLPTELPPGLG